MGKKRSWAAAFVLLLALFALSGCKGNDLPEGMDEETLLNQGREIVTLLNGEEWQTVYDQMRTDGQETTDAAGIEAYMRTVLDEAGAYVRETDCMATGQKLESTGEEYGTAVFYCKHEKKNVIYRIAFSTDMELMGLQITNR